MQEIWKDIPGYEGLYIISNTGKIISFNYRGASFHKQIFPSNHQGYKRIVLVKNNVHKKYFMHRLVAETFIPNPFNKPEVNHIDGDKTNNNVNNLEWVSHKENVHHAIKNGLRPLVCTPSGAKGSDSPVSKKVLQMTIEGHPIQEWGCAEDAAKHLNCSLRSIQRVCRHERKTYLGFRWEYVN